MKPSTIRWLPKLALSHQNFENYALRVAPQELHNFKGYFSVCIHITSRNIWNYVTAVWHLVCVTVGMYFLHNIVLLKPWLHCQSNVLPMFVCFFSFFIIARAGVSLMLCQSKVPGVPGEYVLGARSSEKALRTDF